MLRGGIAVVTGASEGIGFELCRLFLEEGCRVIGVARWRKGVPTELLGMNGFSYIKADLSEGSEAVRVARRILDENGGVDFLVNNAGVGLYGPLTECSDEQIDRLLGLNLISVIKMTREFVHYMIENKKRGVIVNVSSLAAFYPIPMMGLYCASKSALKMFTDSLRIEVRPSGIKVIGVYPGYVQTGFAQNSMRTLTTENIVMNEGRGIAPTYTPLRVAKAILDAIKDGKEEVYVSPSGKLLASLSPLLYRAATRYVTARYTRLMSSISS